MNVVQTDDQADIALALAKDKLTPEWMTAALCHGGAISRSDSVTTIEVETISGGMMASSYLVSLTYADETSCGPHSLVAKVPSNHADSKTAGKEIRAYEREVNFYKQLSTTIRMKTPECYFAAIEPESAEFALLLEDLNPAVICKPKDCTVDKLSESLRQLALLHADTWNDSALKEMHWIPDYSDREYVKSLKSYAAQGWQVLKAAADERVPQNFVEVGERLLEGIEHWADHMQGRYCLTHCDYRMTNVMYGKKGESIAIDWQTIHLSRPGTDTFYLIANTLNSDDRKAKEGDLLRTYYDALRDAGVADYSWDECIEDYRFGSIYAVLMVLMTAQGIGGSYLPEAYKKQIFFVVKRYWSFVQEHKTLDCLVDKSFV
jgi:hypothetical protein